MTATYYLFLNFPNAGLSFSALMLMIFNQLPEAEGKERLQG